MCAWLVQVSPLKMVQPNRFLVCFGLIKLLAVREGVNKWRIWPEAIWLKCFDHEKTVDYEKCIYIFSLADATDHASANRMCESSLVRPTGDCPDCKGTLVSIHNKETNDFVANSIVNTPDHTEHPHWIGLRYVVFIFVIGCQINWAFWFARTLIKAILSYMSIWMGWPFASDLSELECWRAK